MKKRTQADPGEQKLGPDVTGGVHPRRSSLAQETVATLKEWIQTGVLKQVLPGEPQLKARLGVGRGTLRRALSSLAQEGWISGASKGCQRTVISRQFSRPGPVRPDQLPVTFLSPHPVEHRVTLQELEETQSSLGGRGHNLRFISPRIFHLAHPEHHLKRLVETHPSAAWILFMTGMRIQRWFSAQKLPALLYELPFPGVELPFVASDWERAAFDAGARLARQGHRHIAILEYAERRPGLLEAERGLQRALAAVSAKGQVKAFWDDASAAGVARSLENAFRLKDRPTALVLTRSAQLLTCYSWLAWRGLRVPADISVVSLANDSWFADLRPPVCHYRPDSRTIGHGVAVRILELAATGQLNRRSLRVPLEYVPGVSTMPV